MRQIQKTPSSVNPDELEAKGNQLYKSRRYDEAAETFQLAVEEYLLDGRPLKAAEMKNNRCVALLQNKQPREALEAAAGTEELFTEAGDRQKLAVALSNQGTALKELKDREQALEKFRQAAEIFQELEQTENYLQVMQSISSLELGGGNPMGAVAAMQSGLANVEKLSFRQRVLKTLLKIPGKLVR
jgi:tetratricopeptide (TPR) repeat protein